MAESKRAKTIRFNKMVREIAASNETPLFLSKKMEEAIKKEREKRLRAYNRKSRAFEGCREYWADNGDIRDTIAKVCNISYDEAGFANYNMF